VAGPERADKENTKGARQGYEASGSSSSFVKTVASSGLFAIDGDSPTGKEEGLRLGLRRPQSLRVFSAPYRSAGYNNIGGEERPEKDSASSP